MGKINSNIVNYLSSDYKKALPGKHHTLGGSNTHRWMICTASVDLILDARKEKKIPPKSRESQDAIEGTYGHELGECCLLKGLNPLDFVGKKFKDTIVSLEMASAVAVYVEYVHSRVNALSKLYGKENVTLLIEASFDLTKKLGYDAGGSADAIILVKNGPIEIIDYKHGSGILVEVENNWQVLFYTWCAWKNFNKKYKFTGCLGTIVQPRMNHENGHIRSQNISIKDIKKWGKQKIIPAVDAVKSGATKLVPGAKQCQWCDVAPICKANAKKQLKNIQAEFEDFKENKTLPDPNTLTVAQLEDIVVHKKEIEKWLKTVYAHLNNMAQLGTSLNRTKLVETYGHRKINDSKKIVKLLTKKGVKKKKLYTEPDLLSPAKIESLLSLEYNFSKDKIAKLLEQVVDKPTLGASLVPLDDKRRAIQASITSDFAGYVDKKQKNAKKRKAEKLINKKVENLLNKKGR